MKFGSVHRTMALELMLWLRRTHFQVWPLQDIVLRRGFCTRISTIICKQPLGLGTSLPAPLPTLLRNVVYSPDPPLLQYMLYHIGNDNIL